MVLSLFYLCDVRKITADLFTVKAVACEPVIIDLKTAVMDRDRHEKPVGINKHGAEPDLLRAFHLKVLDDVSGGKTGADDVLYYEDVLSGDIQLNVLNDAYYAGL